MPSLSLCLPLEFLSQSASQEVGEPGQEVALKPVTMEINACLFTLSVAEKMTVSRMVLSLMQQM